MKKSRIPTNSAPIGFTAFGEWKTLIEWCRDPRCVVSYSTLQARLIRGWDPEDAISVAAHERSTNASGTGQLHEAFGERKSLNQWSQDSRCRVSLGTLIRRVRSGMSLEAAMTEGRLNRRTRSGAGEREILVSSVQKSLELLKDRGELWVSSDEQRITILHDDNVYIVPDEIYRELQKMGGLQRVFSALSISQFAWAPGLK